MQSEAVAPRNPKRYAAFISYSHADRTVARWLHRAIETYRVPANLRGMRAGTITAHRRLLPVFLDRQELSSSSDLAASVRAALQQSDSLIVVCSPQAARSRWVNEEVRAFKALGSAGRIFCLIASGEPAAAASGHPAESECFPPALRFEVDAGRVTDRPAAEPLAADLRPGADSRRDARLKIIAGLLDAPLDDLRRRDQARRNQRMALVAAASIVGCVVLAALAATALVARNEAEAQRQVALRKSLTAQRTADFLVSLFKVSDPSEARGNAVTAREILDRGARQIDESLRAEPQVRAALSTTLGEVYTGLGLYEPAARLLAAARAIPGQDAAASVAQAAALAELETERGNFAQADAALAGAEPLIARAPLVDPQLRARVLLDRGDVAAELERTAQAREYFTRAMQLGAPGGNDEIGVRALEGLAMTAWYAGDMTAAADWCARALAARTRLSGETHPKSLTLLSLAGSIAYMRGDPARAESAYLHLLEVQRRVLGARHPDVAENVANLARLRLEQRRFTQARHDLEDAVQVLVPLRGELDESQTFNFSNLALTYMALGMNQRAALYFHKALAAAVANKHRLHGPILTDLADLECRTGRYRAGIERLEAARPIVAARYPDDPWRSAHVDDVRAGCLAGLGRYAEARQLMSASLPVVLKKWPPESLYGHDALERAVRLGTLSGDDASRRRYAALLAPAGDTGGAP